MFSYELHCKVKYITSSFSALHCPSAAAVGSCEICPRYLAFHTNYYIYHDSLQLPEHERLLELTLLSFDGKLIILSSLPYFQSLIAP